MPLFLHTYTDRSGETGVNRIDLDDDHPAVIMFKMNENLTEVVLTFNQGEKSVFVPIVEEPLTRYLCVNDKEHGCGNVVEVGNTGMFVHTGEPWARDRRFSPFCSADHTVIAVASNEKAIE